MKCLINGAFISQPMNGKTYEEIQDERHRIIHVMREQHGIEITYITNDFDYESECPARTVMLGNSIAKMEASDIIVFVKDYDKAKGCRVEYSVVNEYFEYWRENGGPRVFVECAEGCICELKEIDRGSSNHTTDFSYYYSMLDNITTRQLKDLERIKVLEDTCDQQAEDIKKLSLDLSRLEAIRDKQSRELHDQTERIETLKRIANSVYGIGGFCCPDCRKKYETEIEQLHSLYNSTKARVGSKNKDIDALLKMNARLVQEIKNLESDK